MLSRSRPLTDYDRELLTAIHIEWEREDGSLRPPGHGWLMDRCATLINEQGEMLRGQIRLIHERNRWRRAFWWCFGGCALMAAAWLILVFPALVRLLF